MRKMTVLGVIFAVAAFACGSAPGGGQQGKTLAVVNGERLTEATLAKEVENLPPYVRPILETSAGRAQFLESVITRDLLMREALRRGIDRRPEVADRIAMARKSIVLEALLRDVAEKAPGLSDAALRRIYDADPASHKVGERVRVSHMLFRDKARALEILGRAKAGESFEALMKEIGSGNGEVAADLGEIERGNFVKEFEEVKPKLLAEQREQAQRDAFEKMIADLRSQATVHVLYKPEGPPVSPGAPAPGTAPAAPKTEVPAPPSQGR